VNRWQSEDDDATWQIALPWRRYLRSPSAFYSFSLRQLVQNDAFNAEY